MAVLLENTHITVAQITRMAAFSGGWTSVKRTSRMELVSCTSNATVVAIFLMSIILAIPAQPPNDLEGQIKVIFPQKAYYINCSINATAFDPLSTHGAIAIENGQWHNTYVCIAHCRVESGSSLANLFHAGKSKVDPSGTKFNENENKNETTHPYVYVCYDGFYVKMPKIYEEILINATVFRRNSIETDVSSQREQLYDFVMLPDPWIEVHLSNGPIMNMKLKTIFKLDDKVITYIVLMQNKTGSYYRQAIINILKPIQISGNDKNDSSNIQGRKEFPHEYKSYEIPFKVMTALCFIFFVIIIVIICVWCPCTDDSWKDRLKTRMTNCCRSSNYNTTSCQDETNDDNNL